MRRGRSTMLLLGGVLAILAFFVLYLGLSAAGNHAEPAPLGTPTPEPMAQVVVAASDIPAYTVLKDDMLTIKEVSVSTIVSDATASTVGLVGEMVTRDYKQGTQLQVTDVTDPGISQLLTKGQRAFVLPLQEINNFGGQLMEDDSVDVIWTREVNSTQIVPDATGQAQEKTTVLGTTKTLLQNVKVLKVTSLVAVAPKSSSGTINSNASLNSGTTADTSTTASTGDAAAQQQQAASAAAAQQALYNDQANGQAEPVYSAVAVLAVSDQQAEVLKYMREYGKISLAIRAKGDTDSEQTTGITDKILVQDYGLVLPEIIVK